MILTYSVFRFQSHIPFIYIYTPGSYSVQLSKCHRKHPYPLLELLALILASLPKPASCYCTPWQAVGDGIVLALLPLIDQIELKAPGTVGPWCCKMLLQAFWGVHEQMEIPSLTRCLCMYVLCVQFWLSAFQIKWEFFFCLNKLEKSLVSFLNMANIWSIPESILFWW